MRKNSGAYIAVEDDGFGSQATIDRRNLVFDCPAGETLDNVIDMAP